MKNNCLWLYRKAKEISSGKIGRVVSEPNPNAAFFDLSRMVYSIAFDGEAEVRRLHRRELQFIPE